MSRKIVRQFRGWHLLIPLLAGVGSPNVRGQSYSVDWFTINGGGGTSTGGVFSVSGSIGQPDAGTMSGGAFMLVGGWWSLLSVVQTPGAPLLSISYTSTNTAVISWPSSASGFILQQNSDRLGSTNWSTEMSVPLNLGANRYIIVTPSASNRFYRLYKP